MLPLKSLSKIVLAAYLFFLAWLVLCKLSVDIAGVLSHDARSLNLIPFASARKGEMLDNLIVFIPFGLLLGVNFKQTSLWRKLAFIFGFSLTAELLQFALAIGATDITDVITNTAGGLLGLLAYGLSAKYVSQETRDRFIVITTAILLLVLTFMRFFVFRVRY